MLIGRKLSFRLILSFCLALVLIELSAQDVFVLPEPINTMAYDEIAFISDTAGTQFYFTRTGSPDINRRLYQNGVDIGTTADDQTFESTLQNIYTQIAGRVVQKPIASSINQDIYIAEIMEEGAWHVIHPDYPINSALPNSAVGVMEDPKGLFVLNHFYESGNMYEGISKMYLGGDGGATFPKPIFVNDLENRKSEINVHVTSDGEVAVMALHRTGGPADSDLYISFYTGAEDHWTRPRNLGADINTHYRESTPHLTRDKRHLYFASNRPGGQGGSDLYMCKRLNYSYNKWSPPIPLSNAINSGFDESHPHLVTANNDFYFSSNRLGSFDIFKYEPKKEIEGRTVTIVGHIIDKYTGIPVGADLYYGPESMTDYLDYYSTFNGKFKITINTSEEIKMYPKKAGYETRVYRYDFDELIPEGVDIYEVNLYLYTETDDIADDNKIFNMSIDEIKRRKTLSLHTIQFVRSKAIVLQNSRPTLDELFRLLDENPEIKIRISGHTDNQGARDLLMKLSSERSLAIKAYLVHRGIVANRIETVGRGPDEPLNANENERERSLNRRVEITILD